MKKIFSVFLALAILYLNFFPAFAQGEYIGSTDDLTGYIIPEEQGNGRAIKLPTQIGDGSLDEEYYEIFSITAREVTGLLTSSQGNKDFYLSELPSYVDVIALRAVLHHSLEDYDDGESAWPHLDEGVKFGICYAEYYATIDKTVFIDVYSYYLLEGELGDTIVVSFDIDEYLESGVRYYSYIKHLYHVGYVYGTLELYCV